MMHEHAIKLKFTRLWPEEGMSQDSGSGASGHESFRHPDHAGLATWMSAVLEHCQLNP